MPAILPQGESCLHARLFPYVLILLFPDSCCSMDLYKLEIVLSSAACKGVVINIDGANKPPAYATDTYPSGIPTTAPYAVLRVSDTRQIHQHLPDLVLLASQLSSLDSSPIARVGSVITISTSASSTCPTINSLLLNGKFWYAYFNSNTLNFNCCGTTQSSL